MLSSLKTAEGVGCKDVVEKIFFEYKPLLNSGRTPLSKKVFSICSCGYYWRAYGTCKRIAVEELYFYSKGRFFNAFPLPFDCKHLQCRARNKTNWTVAILPSKMDFFKSALQKVKVLPSL